MSSLCQRPKLSPATIKTSSPASAGKSCSASLKRSKRKQSLPLLVAVRPLNLENEKEKFFKSKGKYNPQFIYSNGVETDKVTRYGEPSTKYLEQAYKILENALRIFGSYSRWEKISGGEIMTSEEVRKSVRKYLQCEGLGYEVQINITQQILSNASMSRVGGKPTINIKEGTTHRNWISGMLNHEIGTHYLRAYNNRKQKWSSKKVRKKFGMLPANPTEEGLASLNTHIDREQPVLIKSALMYITVYLASQMSFSQTYEYLKKYIDTPDARWSYLMRAKRGQTDTSQPGCFPKDQMYLPGILEILCRRKEIDFENLYRLGKVSLRDVDKLLDRAVYSGTRIPGFLLDREQYLHNLERIMICNGLTDEELSALF